MFKLEGRNLGPYRLGERLGQGGAGAVYSAVHGETGQAVAVKLLFGPHTEDPEFLERFRRETEVIGSLQHPAIVRLLDRGEEPDVGPYLVMDRASGRDLRRLLVDEGPLEPGRALGIAARVAGALDHAHGQGVIHRDIKPENLMVDSGDRVVVTDFGIARVSDGTRHTRTGLIPGTPEYMSPEQLGQGPITPAADLYALGVVLYEMITGRTPFASDNVAEVIHRQVYQLPPPPSFSRPGLPPEVDALVLKCLEKKPEQRPESARALQESLVRLQGLPGLSATGPVPAARETKEMPAPPAVPPEEAVPPAAPPPNLPAEVPPAPPEPPGETSFPPPLEVQPTLRVAVAPAPPPRMGRLWLLPLLLVLAALGVAGATVNRALQPPAWYREAVGVEPAPLTALLAGAVTLHGAEVAAFPPSRTSSGLDRARAAGNRLAAALREGRDGPLQGRKDDKDFLLHDPEAGEILRVDEATAAALGSTPEKTGRWWLALLNDHLALRRGEEPEEALEYERDHPLRPDRKRPVGPLFDRVYQRARHQVREGPLPTEAVIQAIRSLDDGDREAFEQAARMVPRAVPKR